MFENLIKKENQKGQTKDTPVIDITKAININNGSPILKKKKPCRIEQPLAAMEKIGGIIMQQPTPAQYIPMYAQDPMINIRALIPRIDEILGMPESEIVPFLKTYYRAILADMSTDMSPWIPLYNNVKFLMGLTAILTETKLSLVDEVFHIINKLTYDYLTQPKDDIDPKLKNLNLELAKTVNFHSMSLLLGRGLDSQLATFFTLARYSSYNENINIDRLNFAIVNTDKEVISTQMIVWIYEALFDTLTELFVESMLTPLENEKEDEYEWITESMKATDSNITIALLSILENMPLEDIKKIIRNYSLVYLSKESPSIRISLRALARGDFPRICQIVEFLEINEQIYIP